MREPPKPPERPKSRMVCSGCCESWLKGEKSKCTCKKELKLISGSTVFAITIILLMLAYKVMV